MHTLKYQCNRFMSHLILEVFAKDFGYTFVEYFVFWTFIAMYHFKSQTWANNHLSILVTFYYGLYSIFYNINDLWITTTCQQRPLFLGREGGRCTQDCRHKLKKVWLCTLRVLPGFSNVHGISSHGIFLVYV